MEAIVLAGGFGTRLAHVIKDIPKPMAPVCEIPFLEYILEYLAHNNVNRAILAVGYKAAYIENYFGETYRSIKLVYSIEDKPLFTGGAIKKALRMCQEENIFILNGDTYFNVQLSKMMIFHKEKAATLSVAVREVYDCERYGTVAIDFDERIHSFGEKTFCGKGIINGGVYLLSRKALEIVKAEKFSFETDFMQKNIEVFSMYAFLSDGYFIDIGIPQDYSRAQLDFSKGIPL